MSGQGSPCRRSAPPRKRFAPWLTCALATTLVLHVYSSTLGEEPLDVRVRLAWGGGEARSWQGTVRLSEGTLSEVTPLGLEPDEPGSMQLIEAASLRIDARSPRTYDGCDVRVRAPADAKLLIQLTAPPFVAPAPLELPLSRVLRDFTQFDLDDRHNHLLAQRSPGDALRVEIERSSLVFGPGEKAELVVRPSHPDLASGSNYVLTAVLTPARTDESLWTSDSEFRADQPGSAKPIPLAVPLPERDGVFDIRLSLFPKRLINTNLVRGKPIATRHVQVAVVAPVVPATSPTANWQSVLAFDPASPKWWEAMTRLPAWTRLPTLPRPVSSGGTKTSSHLGRGWVELGPRAWQAYPLSLSAVGAPHLLEIEYPSDVEQTLAISIIEPDAAGVVGPIGLDSGIDVQPAQAGHQAAVRRHRLPFWPQTRTPYVLLVNRREDRPSLLGKIEVQAGPASLPPLATSGANANGRLLSAYFDKPFFPENFSAPEVLDPVSRRGHQDWLTFFAGGQRMIETLRYGGYNAVVMTAACEGSAIYPSRHLEPTPKYDSGVFFESGQDPVKKDVLELVFRLCDRSGIVLMPAVQFSGPLPALEVIRRQGGEEAAGLEPVGPDGRTWRQRTGSQAVGVYYNLLDERVQQAMLDVVSELADRYGQHASFGGVAVHLSAEHSSLLPDETCSLDSQTFRRFATEKQIAVPPEAELTPATRWNFVRRTAVEPWLQWRCEQVAAFYGRMHEAIAARRPGAKLVLTTAELFAGRQLQAALRPELPQRNTAADMMPLLGLDLNRFPSGVVVPRPQRLLSAAMGASVDLEKHWNQHASLDALFSKQASSLHFLSPAPLRLPDFDAASPFGADKTRTLLVSQIAPAEATFRERFITSLARLDTSLMIDGGWLMPLGQEAALAPLAKVYRRLPPEPFQRFSGASRSHELVVRTLAKPDKTYFYVANPTPWPLAARIEFSAEREVRHVPYGEDHDATAEAQGTGLVWTAQLAPFDLAGGELTGPARVVATSASAPADAAQALRDQMGDIKRRAHFLHENPRRMALPNGTFDELAADGSVPRWIHARDDEAMTIEIDRSQGAVAPGSLHLVNRGTAPLWVRSSPIAAPATGRLQMTAMIRVADKTQQPQLRLAIEGRLDGQVYYQRVNYGARERETEESAAALSNAWTTCGIVRLNLPTQRLTDLRVGFDLMSPGEVWIDDVQVVDLWLQDSEYNELLKTIPTAKLQADEGRLNDCRLLVEGYWPSFLRRHVQLAESAETEGQASLKPAAPDAEPPRTKNSFLPSTITLPKVPSRPARSADRRGTWWPAWMKWK